MAGEDKDVKVKPEAGDIISIVVKDQNSGEVHFKVKPLTKFSKVFNAYAGKKGMDVGGMRFLHDGEVIKGHQTPADLDMEDGDVIDCFLEQVGGAAA